LNDEENDDYSENEDDDEMVSDEEVEDDSENENNLNNDMSDLKEDDMSSNDEESLSTTNTDKNKSTKLFAKKLKEKKVLMDEARQQLPYTFIGNVYKGLYIICASSVNLSQNILHCLCIIDGLLSAHCLLTCTKLLYIKCASIF